MRSGGGGEEKQDTHASRGHLKYAEVARTLLTSQLSDTNTLEQQLEEILARAEAVTYEPISRVLNEYKVVSPRSLAVVAGAGSKGEDAPGSRGAAADCEEGGSDAAVGGGILAHGRAGSRHNTGGSRHHAHAASGSV